VLAKGIGKKIAPEVELLFGETDESNPFVPVEQMIEDVSHADTSRPRDPDGYNAT